MITVEDSQKQDTLIKNVCDIFSVPEKDLFKTIYRMQKELNDMSERINILREELHNPEPVVVLQ